MARVRALALVLAAGVAGVAGVGCSTGSWNVAPRAPEKYEVLGPARGEATGSLGVMGTAFYVIPIGLDSRVDRAYQRALASVPGATGLINVTYEESWYWWVIGTARVVTISGDAIREIEE